MIRTLPLLLALVACNKDLQSNEDADSGTSPGESDGTEGSDGGDGGTDGVSPTIVSADGCCYENLSGDSAFFWTVSASVDDPQGADTISNFFEGGLLVYAGDAEVANYYMACQDGQCVGSFNQSEDNIACGNATAYTLKEQVVDDDCNWSTPYEIAGRQSATAACD